MNRHHFVLRTTQPMYDIERLETQMRFHHWFKRGGLLLLPPGAELVEVGQAAAPVPPEGISAEGSSWAEEIRDG